VCECVCERERDAHRHRDGQRERDSKKETDKQTDKETNRQTERDREILSHFTWLSHATCETESNRGKCSVTETQFDYSNESWNI